MTTEQQLAETLGIPYAIAQTRINGHTINYLTCGSGAPLLLLHGANFGWGMWYPNIPALAQHFTVYAIDLPGAGLSSKLDLKKPGAQKTLLGIVDAFIMNNGLQNVIMVGHSFGGWVALALAAQAKSYLRGVVAASPLGFTRYVPWKYTLLAIRPLAQLIARTAMRPTEAHMRNFIIDPMKHAILIEKKFITYLHDIAARNPDMHPFLFLNSLFAFFRIRKEFMLIAYAPNIAVPVLAMFGQDDPLVRMEHTKKHIERIPHVRLKIFSDTGHVISMERPEEFNRLIISFASHLGTR